MNPLYSVAQQMLMDRFLSDKLPLSGESKLKSMMLAFSGLMALLAVGFILTAAYFWLNLNYPPPITYACMGALSLFIALISLSILYIAMSYKEHRIQKVKHDIIELAENTLDTLEEEFGEPIRDNPKLAVIISSAAGFLAGERFL